jgi:hypothetical protein
MLVDLVQLRHLGAKRSRDDLRSANPIRGHLSLNCRRPGWHPGQRNAPLLAGLLLPGTTEWAIPPLDLARVTTIRDGALVIAGMEEIATGRNYMQYPQAWWCRIVGHASRTSHRSSARSDVERHPSDLALALE